LQRKGSVPVGCVVIEHTAVHCRASSPGDVNRRVDRVRIEDVYIIGPGDRRERAREIVLLIPGQNQDRDAGRVHCGYGIAVLAT
jgi:hypothetical protein